MAQFYTLEEAARVLGMDPDELKSKAQQREVRAFLDGGSWRFRVVDVDELARRRGMGSDPELHLSDLDVTGDSDSAEDILSEYNIGVAADLGQHTSHFPVSGDTGSDHDLLIEELSLPPGPVSGSSSVIIGMSQSGIRLPTDSDVKLVPDNPKGASDSDVRLASPGYKAPSDSDVTLMGEETSDHSVVTPKAGDTSIRQSPLLGSSAEVPAGGHGSDFELTPSSHLMDALQPDSGSDFELTALEEASDEFEATPLGGGPSDSDVTAADPGYSGVNLAKPSDSGINLMAAAGFDMGASSIELAPLSGDDLKPGAKPTPAPKPATAKPAKPKASLAATPPPAVGKGEKDIFDDTDFEVDAFDSGEGGDDKTMQLEAASDFELEESDTGSEVFAIDEEDVDQNASTALGPAAFEEDDEEEDPFAEATSGEAASAWDVESESSGPAPRAAASPMLASSAPSAEWGGLWVGLLSFATVLMLLLAFVSMDLVRNLYEFRSDGATHGIVKSLSGILGDK